MSLCDAIVLGVQASVLDSLTEDEQRELRRLLMGIVTPPQSGNGPED